MASALDNIAQLLSEVVSDAVREALDDVNIEREVDNEIENAVDSLDFGERVQEAVDDVDIEGLADKAVADVVDNLNFDDLMEKTAKRQLERMETELVGLIREELHRMTLTEEIQNRLVYELALNKAFLQRVADRLIESRESWSQWTKRQLQKLRFWA